MLQLDFLPFRSEHSRSRITKVVTLPVHPSILGRGILGRHSLIPPPCTGASAHSHPKTCTPKDVSALRPDFGRARGDLEGDHQFPDPGGRYAGSKDQPNRPITRMAKPRPITAKLKNIPTAITVTPNADTSGKYDGPGM